MSRNPVQLQKRLSLRQLQEKYGTEDQCEAMVRALRWPDGFVYLWHVVDDAAQHIVFALCHQPQQSQQLQLLH